jgi:isoquinoline 1-oxidoreductase subunit alpha
VQARIEVGAGVVVPGEPVDQRDDVGQADAHRFEHGGFFRQQRFLRHERRVQALLALDFAVVRQFQAGEDAQQRGLAGAVAADEADALAGFEREIRVVQERDVSERKLGVREGDEGHDAPERSTVPAVRRRRAVGANGVAIVGPAVEGRGSVDLIINGARVQVQADPAMPLLWVLRDLLQMTGTKFGCGVAACGACTVRIDGQAVRSCVTPAGSVAGRAIQTIEGLGTAARPHPLQAAWIAEQVPQCGYCQSGMLMAAAALLEKKPKPTDADIDEAMSNICRCGTYQRVRAAIKRAAGIRA